MTRFKAALALIATLTLAACYPPVTTHPIGTTAGLKPDPALSGTWRGTDAEGRPGYVHFLKRGDEGRTMAVLVPAQGTGGDVIIAVFSSVRFGSFGYLNVRLAEANGADAKDQPPGTVPVLYRIDGKGTLTLAMMDEKSVKADVAAHTLKGTIEKGETGDVTITEEPAALDKFMASPAALKLFAKPFYTLRKVE